MLTMWDTFAGLDKALNGNTYLPPVDIHEDDGGLV